MKEISQDETKIEGALIVDGGVVSDDNAIARIDWLVTEKLKKLD